MTDINIRYSELCMEIGEYVVKHLLFDPYITHRMREIQTLALAEQSKHNNPITKGTNATKTTKA